MLMVQGQAPMVVFPNPGPPEEVIVIVALAAIAATVVILLPLVKAWARRLSGADTARLEELEQRVVDLEQLESGDLGAMQGELSDLHERLDFAERLLSQAQISKAMPQEPTDETTGIGHAP
jgi:hypothetical protein